MEPMNCAVAVIEKTACNSVNSSNFNGYGEILRLFPEAIELSRQFLQICSTQSFDSISILFMFIISFLAVNCIPRRENGKSAWKVIGRMMIGRDG